MVYSRVTSRSGSEVVSDDEGRRGLDLGGSAVEAADGSSRGRTLGVKEASGMAATVPRGSTAPPSADSPEGGASDPGSASGGTAASGSSGKVLRRLHHAGEHCLCGRSSITRHVDESRRPARVHVV